MDLGQWRVNGEVEIKDSSVPKVQILGPFATRAEDAKKLCWQKVANP